MMVGHVQQLEQRDEKHSRREISEDHEFGQDKAIQSFVIQFDGARLKLNIYFKPMFIQGNLTKHMVESLFRESLSTG